jgi:(p)ppGpp synthase/HD superfamily hydrolase
VRILGIMSPPSLEATLAFALRKHWGQVDKAGAPYILHPVRVMLRMATDEERRVALLHDVVEDCKVTRAQLFAKGYPRREVEAILSLTKRPAEEDDYQAFIRRVSGNPLAARVKLSDLEDNMDVSRLKRVDARAKERLAKYAEAKRYLVAALKAQVGRARTVGSVRTAGASDAWPASRTGRSRTSGRGVAPAPRPSRRPRSLRSDSRPP